MNSETDGINPAAKPSGTGCVECLALGGWWFHLRRCAECGYIGCCDTSPNQHASKHNAATGHLPLSVKLDAQAHLPIAEQFVVLIVHRLIPQAGVSPCA